MANYGDTITIGQSNSSNIFIDSTGINIKNGSTILSNFGETITIGQSGNKNVFISSNGINIRNGSNILANFSDTITIGQNTGVHTIITNDGMEIFIDSNTSVAYYGESARIGEENSARLELSSVELSATNQDGIEGFKVEMDAPGLVAYPKISSSTYSTTTPVTINFYEELENDTLLYGGADIEIGWKERPRPPEYTIIDQAMPWLRGDYSIAQVTWSSTDGWTYTDYYCDQDGSLADASSTCKVVIPFGFSNNSYNNNNAYQFQYGTSKSITITGNVQHFYSGASNTTVTAVISYNGNSSITITVSANSSDLFDYIKMPYVCYKTTTDYSTAITAGTRSGNTGAFSAIFGQGLYAEDNYSVAFGRYNYTDTSNINNTVLTIGNGDSETNRSNALTVDWNGNVEAAGEVAGVVHTYGAITGGTWSSKSIGTGTTWKELANFTIPEDGVWLLIAELIYASNATGHRTMSIATSSATPGVGIYSDRRQAINGTETPLRVVILIQGNTKYYVNTYHGASSALTCQGRYTAFKIGNSVNKIGG